jgi:hypothetical protein
MAIKQLGVAPSATTDAATKDYVDTEVNAHAVMAIPFHVSGSLTTGVKTAEFIAPFAMTVTSMRGRCAAGSGATYRPSKNGGTADGTTSAATGTTVVTTAQSVSLAAGDRLTVNVVNAGTSASDLSVTFGATY